MLRTRILVTALAVMSSAPSVEAQICTPFTDVAASNPFCGNIQWMFNRGITSGCGTNLFCPNDFMPREQMAAFMNRLADKVTFQQGGNSFGAAGELGTTDDQVLEVIVNNSRVMRYEPNAVSPNVIGGSPANNATSGVRGATIGGGGVPTGNTDPNFTLEAPNRVTDAYGTVAGGYANRAGDDAGSTLDGAFATVGGGNLNIASGIESTIAGGTANLASGTGSAIPGGSNNAASGSNSFAAGRAANANGHGCFVWGDDSTSNTVSCGADNRFAVRSVGGVFFYAAGNTQATYTGVELPAGGTAWVPASDRRIKEHVRSVDTQDVLQKLLALPITTWNLKTQDASIRHMGAMAQDFRAAFGLGETELGINTLDADGVALAAIQGLNAKLETKIDEQAREIAELRRTVERLIARIGPESVANAQR